MKITYDVECRRCPGVDAHGLTLDAAHRVAAVHWDEHHRPLGEANPCVLRARVSGALDGDPLGGTGESRRRGEHVDGRHSTSDPSGDYVTIEREALDALTRSAEIAVENSRSAERSLVDAVDRADYLLGRFNDTE